MPPSDAASPCKFPGLETLFAEHWTPLRRLERDCCLLATSRARRDSFDPLPGGARTGWPARALRFAGLAPLRLVLEVLVGEELLLASCPYELRAAIHAPEDPVLELHRSLPRRGRALLPIAGAT